MLYLDPWEKVAVMAGAAFAVALTILGVVCTVGRGCWLYEVLNTGEKKQRKAIAGSVYGTQEKKNVNLVNYTIYGGKDRIHAPASNRASITSNWSEKASILSDQSLAGRLSSGPSERTRKDSTYSSMSSSSALSSTSTIPECFSPPLRSPPDSSSASSVTFSIQCTASSPTPANSSKDTSKICVTVESCADLPSRDYGAHCDPWVSVSILKDRRSLRRRSATPISHFKTKTIRHAHNPIYSQIFVSEVHTGDLKDIRVKLTVWDQDRHSGATEIGSTGTTLKEAKQLGVEPERMTITQILTVPKKECGEMLFGMSYLPTAQRFSFSIIKASNLKLDRNNGDDAVPNPYVRIMMFNQSGRMIKKKKTTVQINTRNPIFNETINFEVGQFGTSQLEFSTFVLAVCDKRNQLEEDIKLMTTEFSADSSDQEGSVTSIPELPRRGSGGKSKDVCIGKVAVGRMVRGNKEREHWQDVASTPRKVFSQWHTLK